MLQPPAKSVPEFGKRQVRPAMRRVEPARPRSSLGPRRVPGASFRSFVAPGATAHLPKTMSHGGSRLSVVLALAAGVIVGTAVGPSAVSQIGSASAAVSQIVIPPAATLTASLSSALGQEISRAQTFAVEVQTHDDEAMRQAVARAPDVAGAAINVAQDLASGARDALAETGHAVLTSAHEAYDGAKSSATNWLNEQVAEGVASAKLMKRELSPAMAALTALADRTANQIADDMDRSERLAQMERTGLIVDAASLPSPAENDARIAMDAQALVRASEQKIAAVEPSRIDLSDLGPHATKAHKGFGPANAYAYSGYELTGNTVKIGGEKVDAHVVRSITHAAKVTGNDPVYLASVASRESSFRPQLQASTSSASGLFQFLKQTWLQVMKNFGSQYGYEDVAKEIKAAPRGYVVANPAKRAQILAMRSDPLASATMAAAMEKSDRAVIEKVLGRAPTAGERYMAHFFGSAEAARFLSLAKQWPDGPAADYFYKAAMANKSLFWGKDGTKKTFTQVAAGFKTWFEGPDGGMRRFQAFEQAAAAVDDIAPTATQREASRPAAVAAPRAERHASVTTKHRAHPVATPTQAAAAEKPAGHARSASAPAPVTPQVQVAALDGPTEAAKPAGETIVYETEYVRTPIVPGKPASYRLTSGRIVSYIDAHGKLSSMATSVARSEIIESFGPNFSRLPASIQDHLKNASQFDLNMLAPYAKLMPRTMRDGFASEGLVFVDAVPQTGGRLVAVRVPKRVVGSTVVASAAQTAAPQSEPAHAEPEVTPESQVTVVADRQGETPQPMMTRAASAGSVGQFTSVDPRSATKISADASPLATDNGPNHQPGHEPPERPKVVHADQYLREEDEPYAPRFGL
ncbi:hypothetical protein ACVIGB_001053 [Bradyrhizobium sp. USDA 4341]